MLCILVLLVQFIFFLIVFKLFQVGKFYYEKYNKKYTKYFIQYHLLKNQDIAKTKHNKWYSENTQFIFTFRN